MSVSSEEEEPKFKYKRMLNSTTEIFRRDAASCFVVHEKLIVLGTQKGHIHVLDHLANQLENLQFYNVHETAVNALSLDLHADYLASCSNDGKIFICGLASNEYNQSLSLDRPIRCVHLDPEFRKNQQFVTADRTLVLHEKGFFQRKKYVLYSGKEKDGFIHLISWKGPYIAFANDSGVRVYDKSLNTLITHVKRQHDLSLRCELYPARICWMAEQEFCITWADTVTVCSIKPSEYTTPELPAKSVEIVYMWDTKTSHYISDVNYIPDKERGGWQQLILVAICKTDEDGKPIGGTLGDIENMSAHLPRILIVEPLSFETYDVVNEDIIKTNEAEKRMCHEYHLSGIADDSLFFLLSNKDMIDIRPCSPDDHIDWLLQNGRYGKALDYTRTNLCMLDKHTVQDVGSEYINQLLKKGKYLEAAELCPKVCGKKKDVWEMYANKFMQCKQLRVLAPILPTNDPRLEPESYQEVLVDFLRDDVCGFKKLVYEWSPDLYRVSGLIKSVLDRFGERHKVALEDADTLMSTLGKLYTYERNYEKAVQIYMRLRDRQVFKLIDDYKLFDLVKDQIRTLMDIDTDLAVRLLLENEDSLSAQTVMKQLTKQPKLQIAYLDRLFARNEGDQFADLAVTLYAEHDKDRLLSFLRRNEHYKLDKALELCKQKSLVKEAVFLLGRSGNRREALNVIINQMKKIEVAIDFCKEHTRDEPELWNDLIEIGVNKPEFIVILLQNIGTYVDPTILIRRIPPTQHIPHLRDSLVKILHDYAVHIDMMQGCRRVTLNDTYALLQTYIHMNKKGIHIKPSSKCVLCSAGLIGGDRRFANNIGVFLCQHTYHDECLKKEHALHCPVCVSGRKQLKI